MLTSTTRTASGTAWSLKVACVIMPSVPSDPTNRLVKLYPATDLLQINTATYD